MRDWGRDSGWVSGIGVSVGSSRISGTGGRGSAKAGGDSGLCSGKLETFGAEGSLFTGKVTSIGSTRGFRRRSLADISLGEQESKEVSFESEWRDGRRDKGLRLWAREGGNK